MKQFWKTLLLGIGVFFILPWSITWAMSGKLNITKSYNEELEVYLPILLSQQISWDYEEETLKAQAVLARSSLYLYWEKDGIGMEEKLMRIHSQMKYRDTYRNTYERMLRAVEDTRGEVLVYQNSICEGVFHKVSAGTTRNGVEVFQDVSYRYLDCVKSENDICAETYLNGHYFSEEALRIRLMQYFPETVGLETEIFEKIQIAQKDSSGYVTRVKLGDKEVSGEAFRESLALSSSNFSIQQVDGKIRFLCKGLGHGFGMSQFGANQMAKNGSDYISILNYYFPKSTVQKIDLPIEKGV